MSDTRSDSRYDLRTRGSTIPTRPRAGRASSVQEPRVSNQQGANPPRDTETPSHTELLPPADSEINFLLYVLLAPLCVPKKICPKGYKLL